MGAATPALAGSAAIAWDEPIEVVSGDAFHGPWRMNRSQFLFVDDPTVAVGEKGDIGVAWVDQSRKDIFFQLYTRDGTKHIGEPVNVSRTPGIFSWLPRMVIVGGESISVFLLWQEIIFSGGSHGGEILFARSRDNGRTFDGPINLSNSLAGDGKGRLTRRYWDNGSLDLAAGPEGTLFAAWTEYDGVLWFSRSTDGGDSFSAPMRIRDVDGAGPARGPSLAVDSESNVFLAWTVGEDASADVRVARSEDAGRSFGAPRIVAESRGHSDAPKVVVDRHRTVHLVYAESPEGMFDQYELRYSRSNDGARTFDKARVISDMMGESYQSSHYPTASVDGAGNLYVLWELFPNKKGRSRGLGFTVSIDAGRTFAPPTVVPGSDDSARGDNGSRQGLLMRKMAVHRTGAIAVVNSTFKHGEASHVRLFRGHLASP